MEKNEPLPAIRYCLYARKSMEAEERQALSIDSQIKEMGSIAEKDHLHIAIVKTEAHSAKNSGERKVFNDVLEEIKLGKYNGILTWAADRLSRNAGDLGRLVDLMDNQLLQEIRTYNQTFTNSPNEKFLLMILGSQAKLENDNRGINVKRGLRALVERGCWPGVAPIGYRCSKRTDRIGHLRIDPVRGYVIKMIFEKAARGRTPRQIRNWLKSELDFFSNNGKHLSLSTVQLILKRTLYYGEFEYPKGSGNWYKGRHQPLVTKEIFNKVQLIINKRRHQNRIMRRNFAYTKLMKCGRCGSGITAEEKIKHLKDGSVSKYVYYGCTRVRDPFCKLPYMREEDIINKLCLLVDKLTINTLGVRGQIDLEVDRLYRFHRDVIGNPGGYENNEQRDIDTKKYMKYLLREGTIEEKRHVLLNLKSRIIVKDKKLYLDEETEKLSE